MVYQTREYRVTRVLLELLYHLGTNIGDNLLDYLLTGLSNKEVVNNKDEDEVDVYDDDDDGRGLDSEVFEQGRSSSSDRSTEFELDSRE